jgi:S-adenosylmethionine:tRNA ribosyltransferase-isomerase
MTDIAEYDYELPKRLIAQNPLANRADARLMVVDREQEQISHYHVRDLPELLRSGDCLVLNDSRVVPARLVGYRDSTGGRWEGLFLNEVAPGEWQVLGKARGHLVSGETITLVNMQARPEFRLRLLERSATGEWRVRPEPLSPEPAATAWELLDRVGRVPLPHYIRQGEMLPADLERYQTVFAENPGSVAAPTAGLHFTPELLRQIAQRGNTITRVTLHVGMGTFRPIGTATVEEHTMHAEWAEIGETACHAIAECRARGGRVIAVGTTSMRTLESAAAATSAGLVPWSGETRLFIRPGFEFKICDGLMTNFHLPRTSLLVLVRTFGGPSLLRRAYEMAIAEEYRFFSYGDTMLIV